MILDGYSQWAIHCAIAARRWEPRLRMSLLELCAHVRDNGYVQLSVPRLAERYGLSERQTQRVLHELARRGLLAIEAAKNEIGRQTANRYRLLADFLRETANRGFANLAQLAPFVNRAGGCLHQQPACEVCLAQARAAPA
jgi:predicted ArsR family transcriptional regulator